MVRGLDKFRDHFQGYEENYVLIGGTTELRDTRPSVKMLYVPFYFTPGVFDVSEDGLTEDKDRARRIFEKMRKDKGTGR